MDIRKILRNPRIEILLILGLSILAFITINASELMVNIQTEQKY